MKTSTGNTMAGTTVQLDGTKFVDCTFMQCTLVYKGGELPEFGSGTTLKDCTLNAEGGTQQQIDQVKAAIAKAS